jgi:hypothetical protein
MEQEKEKEGERGADQMLAMLCSHAVKQPLAGDGKRCCCCSKAGNGSLSYEFNKILRTREKKRKQT